MDYVTYFISSSLPLFISLPLFLPFLIVSSLSLLPSLFFPLSLSLILLPFFSFFPLFLPASLSSSIYHASLFPLLPSLPISLHISLPISLHFPCLFPSLPLYVYYYSGSNTYCKSSEPLKTIDMLCYVITNMTMIPQ